MSVLLSLYHGSVILLLARWVSSARPESVRALRREGLGMDTKCPGGTERKLDDYPLNFSAALLDNGAEPRGDNITEMLGEPYYFNNTVESDSSWEDDSWEDNLPPESERDPTDGANKWIYLYAGVSGDAECHMGPPIRTPKECKRVAKLVWKQKDWNKVVTITRKDPNRTRYPSGCSMKGRILFLNKYKSGENQVNTRPVCKFNLRPDARIARDLAHFVRQNYGDNVRRSGLKLSPQLSQAAWAHARDMSKRDYFSHKAPDPAPFGAYPKQRSAWFMHQGPPTGSENLAGNFADHESALAAWMKSFFHAYNIMRPQWNTFGYAFYDGCMYYPDDPKKPWQPKVHVQFFGQTW